MTCRNRTYNVSRLKGQLNSRPNGQLNGRLNGRLSGRLNGLFSWLGAPFHVSVNYVSHEILSHTPNRQTAYRPCGSSCVVVIYYLSGTSCHTLYTCVFFFLQLCVSSCGVLLEVDDEIFSHTRHTRIVLF